MNQFDTSYAMEFQQTHHTIDFIVKKIRAGRLALPDFQREFVWTPGRVVELLDSVSRQWPIGSLLLLSGPQEFAFRSIDAGPAIHDGELDMYILDGQQRVTALYHAIAEVSDYTYFVDFKVLLSGDDDPIRWEKRSRFLDEYPDIAARAKSKVALISEIWDAKKFYQWLKFQPNETERNRLLSHREDRLSGLHSNVYKIFAIELDQSIELEALARIFETLNRTGVALNAFDLMVAALYPRGFRLRDEWEKAKESNLALQRLAPDELELLKLIALLARMEEGRKAARGVRQGDLLSMERGLFKKYWARAVYLYNEALGFCNQHFGVTSKSVVPSWTMILGIAVLLHKKVETQIIEQWWLNSIIDQTFAQAANTAIVASVDAWAADEMDTSGTGWLDPVSYLDVGARSSGLFTRGLAALIVGKGGVDILSGKRLADAESLVIRALDDEMRQIRRLGASDTISQIVVVTGDTDRRLGKAMSFDDIPRLKEHLKTQGVERYSRTKKYMQDIFQPADGRMQ